MRALFALLLLPALARADASVAPALGWIEGPAARAALAPWSACPAIAALLPAPEGYDPHVSVRPAPNGLDLALYSAGSGRWAYASTDTWRLTRGRCDAIGYSVEGGKESSVDGLIRHSLATPLPTLSTIAAIDGARLVTSPDGDDLAAARILAQLARDGGADGSLPSLQPDHPGPPHGSPTALWPPALLAAAQVKRPWLMNESRESFDAIRTYRVRDPAPFLEKGRWQIWDVRFRARLGGGLLAIYDRQENRHRWIYATDYDNPSSPPGTDHFDARFLDDDHLLLINRFDGDVYRWSIHLPTGRIQKAK